jgi:hypothetical protein
MRVAAQDLENAREIMARLRTELPIPAGIGLVDHCLALRDQLAAAKVEQERLSGQVQYLKDQVKG